MKSRVPGVGDSGAYTDLNRLNQLKTGKDRDSEANVRKVAQEFESLFVNEMFKAMRSANQALTGDSFLNTETTKHYQQMHDQQLAVTLSREGGGIGLADVLVRQMTERKGSHRPNPFATPDQAVLGQVATPLDAAAATEVEAVRDDRAALRARRLTHLPVTVSARRENPPNVSAAPIDAVQDGKPLVDLGWHPSSGNVLPGRFESPEQFAAALLPMAENAARRLGVDPRYLVAQAALETGWGASIIQGDNGSSHNLFGIKAHGGWQGASAETLTTEYYNGQPVKESARFRAYDSFAQSFEDYVDFLQGNGRYQEALKSADNPDRFMSELQKAGYATDPQYASKVNQIARQLQTYQMVAAAGSNKNS